MSFKVVPYGTLHRSGTLQGLRLENRPEPGQAAVVAAIVKNTGQIATRPEFHGSLYLNGRIFRGVQSVPVLVLPGQTSTINMVVDTPRSGAYTLKGQADFDGTESGVRSLTFQIGASSFPVLPWVLGGVALIVAGVLVWLARRRRRRRPLGGGPKHAPGGRPSADRRVLVDSVHQ